MTHAGHSRNDEVVGREGFGCEFPVELPSVVWSLPDIQNAFIRAGAKSLHCCVKCWLYRCGRCIAVVRRCRAHKVHSRRRKHVGERGRNAGSLVAVANHRSVRRSSLSSSSSSNSSSSKSSASMSSSSSSSSKESSSDNGKWALCQTMPGASV